MTESYTDVPTITHGDKVTWSIDDEGNCVLRSLYAPGVPIYLERQDTEAITAAQDAYQTVAFVRAAAMGEDKQIDIELVTHPSIEQLENVLRESS